MWIADNKQDPNNRTRSVVLDLTLGLKNAFKSPRFYG